MSVLSPAIPLPTVPPLPAAAKTPIFTGQQPQNTSDSAPRKPEGVTDAGPSVIPESASVTAEHLDPADFASLRQVLETTGHFTPAPPEPPWTDPRPDLVADHAQWEDLLGRAWRLDAADPEGVYGALNGMRCCGARLEIAGPPNYSLQPEGPLPTWRLVRGTELSEAEYADLRQRYLLPHREALTRLLSAPSAAQIAHPRAAPAQTTGKTPEKDRHTGAAAPVTGHSAAAAAAQPAPRKNSPAPAAQPALLEVAAAAQPAPVPGGDW